MKKRDLWPPPSKKLPPPEHGLKIKRAGTTWWGARWIEALERISASYEGRLGRGRTYARGGRTHDLVVRAGEARARVTGSRPQPYDVRIALAKLDDETWSRAIAAMAAESRFAAELLAGEMPLAIDDVFRAAGASLFPTREADLETSCSCPDWANPCKHVAAVHYVLGDAIDRDPFLLFELRGRTREQVLSALRDARKPKGKGHVARRDRPTNVPTTSFRKIDADAFDAWRTPPPDLSLSMAAPPISGALLRQLGAPPSWRATRSPADALGATVRAASLRARAIALGQAESGDE